MKRVVLYVTSWEKSIEKTNWFRNFERMCQGCPKYFKPTNGIEKMVEQQDLN